MNHQHSPTLGHEDRLAELILQYIDAIEMGNPIDRTRFIQSNPEFRNELEQFFASRDQVEGVAAALRKTAYSDWDNPFYPSPFGSANPHKPGEAVPPSTANDSLGQLGDFRLMREIGRGGMGIVYEAEQISLQRRIALKVLPFAAAIDAKHVQRFRNEALAAGMLNHAHIVPVYSVGNERGVHYYSMQLVDGQSLASLIAELCQQKKKNSGPNRVDPGSSGPSDPARKQTIHTDKLPHEQDRVDTIVAGASETRVLFQKNQSSRPSNQNGEYYRNTAKLMQQAAGALQHAHESGIVHRDIKPANLLVDSGGQIHITDFGLAQIRSQVGLTRTGDTPGTLRYMSPEQAAGKQTIVDHRTDIYSLGATFYELLTLSPIFEGHDVQELLTQVFDSQPKPLRSLDKSIPVELETIILKAINKSPEDRYATAGDLSADLNRYLSNQPILAKRPSAIDRARKWARRHPSAVIASLVALLFVSTISITAFVLIDGAYHRERLRANEAEAQFQLARRSIDELVRVSEEELAYNPAAESARRHLLTSVLSYYQEFLERSRDTPQAQEGLEEASSRVKTILNGLGALRAKGQIKLLGKAAVATDLRLSEEQQKKASELLDRVEGLWQETFRDIGTISAAELERRYIEQSRLNEADLKAMLSPTQLQRLYQLDLQADVAAAFREPEVNARLRITENQRDQIRTIEQREMALWRANHQPKVPGTRAESPIKDPKPGLTKNAKILELLTTEQRIAWRELTGTPLNDIQR